MSRTLKQITTEIKEAFVSNETLRSAYGLDPMKTFDQQFSSVSIEAGIVAIVAFVAFVGESVVFNLKKEIDERITTQMYASLPWWHEQCLNFQYGHELVLNNETFAFGYEVIDEQAQIVKFASVRQQQDACTSLAVFVNKADKGALSGIELDVFERYIKKIAPAGIQVSVFSEEPDRIKVALQVVYNPLLLNSEGKSITGGNYPVKEAIHSYADSISLAGQFNKNHLIDEVQRAEGVVDVVLESIYQAKTGQVFEEVTGPDAVSQGGAFTIHTITDTYTPALI